MFSAVASGYFALRNVDKTQNGEVGRSAVALGQTAGLVQEAAKYEGAVANTARSTISVFSKLAKQHKAFEYAGKVTQFAVNNVNPLICASGVVKTAIADDKIKTGVTETAALATMFAGEALVKDNYDKIVNSPKFQKTLTNISNKKFTKPLFEYLEKHKLSGKAGAIVKGLTFVAGSMTSYAVGQKLGDNIAGRVKANLHLADSSKIDRKA